MTAAILHFPSLLPTYEECAAARQVIRSDAGWPDKIDAAVTLANSREAGNVRMAQAVLDAYTAQADRAALVDRARRDWWQLALAAMVGVAFGMLIMGVQ